MKSLDDYGLSLTIKQLAESQGICQKTARRWCLKEGLDSYKVGNTRRVRTEVLIAWIQKREQDTRFSLK
ncbi:helix-turn-helix domain-containing protein [Paenibacillus graminis]|uniref:helix-turn-helix domain-containing protein n=1 Tax=Paenibacillus graminis TaxID=189425 RepID=UPI002DB73602|nr:helix-turn-helix domain-containing protein [Paenibacillus graminis]MEC0173014.1 helix-turn-helix domain-containing protein [Paenibacillus graminis]